MRLQMTWMLVLAAGPAVATAADSGEPNEEKAAIAEIKRLGGWFDVYQKGPDKPAVCVDLRATHVTDINTDRH